MKNYERLIGLELLRATENASIQSSKWLGKGDKEGADEAACDAIRGMFDVMDIRGEVVIGEGIKDKAPGLFQGEKVGRWNDDDPRFDIALDPVDGTTNVSKGMQNSISCIAAAAPSEGEVSALQDIPAFYLDKLSYCSQVKQALEDDPSLPLHIDCSVQEIISTVANILERDVADITVMVLDRERNQQLVTDVRKIGAKLRMIGDGDITAAMAPAIEGSNIDLYMGIGGAPEGVLSAAGLRCLGGGQQAKIWPASEQEKQELISDGWADRLDTVFHASDLAKGDSILFCATGISDSPLLAGVQTDSTSITTHSIMMRYKSKTVRFVESRHMNEHKQISLRSES